MTFSSARLLFLFFMLWVEVALGYAPNCRSTVSRVSESAVQPNVLRSSSGADIEQPPADDDMVSVESISTDTGASGAVSPLTSGDGPSRGKVNEIDFCIAPADVSLSRSYAASAVVDSSAAASPRAFSLTRALNNASNRAVRRILLARSWPSAEALNLSLRQVLAADKQRKEQAVRVQEEEVTDSSSSAKCPVPRPILNILVGQKNQGSQPIPRGRTDAEYVADQLTSFREKYSAIPGFPMAEAYLECILSLATSGVESQRVSEVLASGVYDESYRRVVAVLKSVGTIFEGVDGDSSRRRIAAKLIDQDFCLSMLDKMTLKQPLVTPGAPQQEVTATTQQEATVDNSSVPDNADEKEKSPSTRSRLKFWRNREGGKKREEEVSVKYVEGSDTEAREVEEQEVSEITQDDLGGVLLSAEEPSMTRQLNVLSNIVQRALLFGGDQELLVLSETLAADTPAFIQRWYPESSNIVDEEKSEARPGVQYLNCLVQLLRDCYNNGVVTTMAPPVKLIPSYDNAYERLIASLVELGSGYIRLVSGSQKLPVPRTAQEELGRFAVWESNFRKSTPDISSYPEDLEGSWQVMDEIGGETIGSSTVVFKGQGRVDVAPPMEGLRWRLDPGPTHLDTCTFQVLGEDGAVLQYRGFIDRGARLEARFSKRPITIRGSVMFQMRDGESALMGDDYWKDMLPVNYKTGTTKFAMTKTIENKK